MATQLSPNRPTSAAERPTWLFQKMTPIIKVVGDFCNLKCAYCFYNQRDQITPHVITVALLKKFISQYLQMYDGRIQFIWHGGEPLMTGLDFYRTIIEIQQKYRSSSHTIRNLIQTNGTLITDEWAQFFKEHGFGVGISVDGDRASHDHHRTNHSGEGSFDSVMKGIETLRKHGLIPGTIQTLTRDNLKNACEDFSFFTKVLGVKSLGINHFFADEKVDQRMREQSITNEELTAYLKHYIEMLLQLDDKSFVLREWENFFAGVFGCRASNCTFNGMCSFYFCLEYDGRIYPCDRLSGREDLLFGNLSRESLEQILTGTTRRQYAEAVNTIHPDCAQCRWYHACHNGCAHHRVGGIAGKYYFCETRKAVFSSMEELLKNHAEVSSQRTTSNTERR